MVRDKSGASTHGRVQMLTRITAGAGPLLIRTSRLPLSRFLLRKDALAAYGYLAVLAAFSLLAAVLVWPMFGGDFPPGVDTPTFLHLSWVTKLAASGQLSDPFQDPYWYGGFSYLVAYPPLGYGLVGVVSFVTGLDLIDVYVALLVLSYGGVAAVTLWLASELGLSRWTAVLAGLLAALAYPVLSSVFLWGWFTSVMALPLGLAAILFIERSLRTGRWGLAALGGLCMALSILIHHMTGLGLTLGLVGWFAYHLASGTYPRRQTVGFTAVSAAVAMLVIAPWGIPFLMHALDVGFRREVPGLWLPNLTLYRDNIVDNGLIGEYIYPSYMGITLLVLATGGTILALVERRRLAGLAVALLVLAWFSMGADLNPLVKIYPFSGLDVARFHLYMAPFMALMGAALVERVFGLTGVVWPAVEARIGARRTVQVRYSLAAAVLAAILIFPVLDARYARQFMAPYEVERPVSQALASLTSLPASDGTDNLVYSLGLWNWDAFLIPYLSGRPLMDGWHDEGAKNVSQIRRLRIMAWTGDVDIDEAHRLMDGLGTRYVLIDRFADYQSEASNAFWDEMEARPDLFTKLEQWDDVATFRVLRGTNP